MSQYYQHPHYEDMVPGHYTDDTQRSIANAWVVLSHHPKSLDIYNPVTYLDMLLQTYRFDPRPGYSRKFEAFLRDNLDIPASEVFHKINRAGSNGSVMGAAVLGYLGTPEMVMNAAAAQALSTHAYTTIPCAQIVALSAHYFIENIGPKSELLDYLTSHLGADVHSIYSSSPQGRVDMKAESVTGVMLNTVPREYSLARLIEISVDRGGDTDSVAAVMVAIASCSKEYENDIPQALLDGLENGPHGHSALFALDAKLSAMR